MDNSTQHSIDHVFKQLNDRANLVYKFAMLYSDYMAVKKDYGTGLLINMVEMHTLTSIQENPGITASQLSKMWDRTPGAISQTLTKLQQKKLIERKKDEGNAKTILLYATPEGERLSRAHKTYDAADVAETMQELMKNCTTQEIDDFFKVISYYIQLF
mgnify:CR=1 FL=1